MLATVDISEIYHAFGLKVCVLILHGFKPLLYVAALSGCLYGFWQTIRTGDLIPFATRFLLSGAIVILVSSVRYSPAENIVPSEYLSNKSKIEAPMVAYAAKVVTDKIIISQAETISKGAAIDWSMFALSRMRLPDDVRWYAAKYDEHCTFYAVVSETNRSKLSEILEDPLGDSVALLGETARAEQVQDFWKYAKRVSTRDEYESAWKEFWDAGTYGDSSGETKRPWLDCLSAARLLRQKISMHIRGIIGEENYRNLAGKPDEERKVISSVYRKDLARVRSGETDFLSGNRAVVAGQEHRVQLVPEGDSPNATWWGRFKSGLNDGYNWLIGLWSTANTEIGQAIESKSTAYSASIIAPYFWGFSIVASLVVLPFFVFAAFFRFTAFFWWLKLYVSVKIWPLFWSVLYVFYQGTSVLWSYEDRGAILAIPYLFIVTPVISYIAINSAFGFVRDGVGGMFTGAQINTNSSGLSEIRAMYNAGTLPAQLSHDIHQARRDGKSDASDSSDRDGNQSSFNSTSDVSAGAGAGSSASAGGAAAASNASGFLNALSSIEKV